MTAYIDVQQFQKDLHIETPREVVRKYITTGFPVAIDSGDYYLLRRTISSEFDIHPSAVVVVGSTRTGFSIAPTKRYNSVREDSDLDVALVSAERFDDFWMRVFIHSREDLTWKKTRKFKVFKKTLFSGWIDPRGLPPGKQFEPADRWSKFFDSLMKSRRFGVRQISARLYRTWEHLELYHELAVTSARDARAEAK